MSVASTGRRKVRPIAIASTPLPVPRSRIRRGFADLHSRSSAKRQPRVVPWWPVLATDIDALSVRIARDNARLNRAGTLVHVRRANGLASSDISARVPFDLVFANILLMPLQKLATPLTRIVASRGRVILSGLLNAQANAARAAYPKFKLERRIMLEGWTTLVLKRGAAVVRNGSRR